MKSLSFLKWPGGKTRSSAAIVAALPERIATYYEPFCGAASVFFALADMERFDRAVLADSNPELVKTLAAVRDDVEGVIRRLEAMLRHPMTAERYAELRASRPRGPHLIAMRMILLNRSCFNGLYRVNRRGEFNSPYGNVTRPRVNFEQLRRCSRLLQKAEIHYGHYHQVLYKAAPGDAVYFDPPYDSSKPEAPGAGFRAYTKDGFDRLDQYALASAALWLQQKRIAWVASNANTPLIREAYAFARYRPLTVTHTIGAKAASRPKAKELLIWSSPEQ